MADSTPAAPAEAAPFDIEKPACFYLGREYDLARRAVLPDQFVMYDARDLTTHGVIVGMTGSGKTGLAIGLLEEAAIDGVPSIIIDPKGDLTNLLLQFPDLAPASFEPWVDSEEARQKGLAPKELAEKLAARWRKGLEESAQPADRVARLKASSDWRVYTPGSEAGLPLSILSTFAAPKGRLPREALTQKIDATATALLGLTGLAADPVQSREHILVAQLLLHAWTAGRDLDLPRLILEVQSPPIGTVGAYNLETFFPAKDRLKFASLLNNVLAAPSFSTWTMGEPLDLASMLYRAGRPQQLIFYVAHLDDTQRMFFITLLLEEVLSWVRRQPGTSNLRALLYFDEVFGYLPPYPANPPSKGPLLTLLKQARAFGVGVLLATQNPVDLDYKALSNAGTWFVGKLQTERDKARLLEGLESVAAEQGTLTDRAYVETVISSLGGRVFLLHDVHRPAPVLFQSRWTLSYLRGPLMPEQVSRLMAPLKERPPLAIPLCTHCHAELGPEVGDRCPACGRPPWANAQVRLQDQQFRAGLLRAATSAAPSALDASVNHLPPVLPPDVRQFYLPAPAASGAAVEYQPAVLGFAEVVFPVDKRKGREHRVVLRWLAAPSKSGRPVDWAAAQPLGEQLDPRPLANARWASVPESLDTGRKLKALEKAFAEYVYSTQKLALYENRALGLVSEPGEGEPSFRGRCRLAAQEKILKGFELERAKFGPKFDALDAELPDQADAKRGQTGSWVGWLNPFGEAPRKKPQKAKGGGKQEEKLRKLQADYQAKKNEIEERWKHAAEEVVPVEVKPRKADVRVTHFGLAWAPRS